MVFVLEQGDGHQRVQRWRLDNVPYWRERFVVLGVLAGRWYVAGDKVEPFDTEQEARARAAELTAGEDWVECPANFDARNRPIPPEGWVQRGGYWVRG